MNTLRCPGSQILDMTRVFNMTFKPCVGQSHGATTRLLGSRVLNWDMLCLCIFAVKIAGSLKNTKAIRLGVHV